MIKNWFTSLSNFFQFLWAGSQAKLAIKDLTIRGLNAPIVVTRILAYNESLKKLSYLKSGFTIEQIHDVADAQIELERVKNNLNDIAAKYPYATEGERIILKQEQREIENEVIQLSKKATNLDANIAQLSGLTEEQINRIEEELKNNQNLRNKCIESIYLSGNLSGTLDDWLNQSVTFIDEIIIKFSQHPENTIDDSFFGLILNSVQKRKQKNLGVIKSLKWPWIWQKAIWKR